MVSGRKGNMTTYPGFKGDDDFYRRRLDWSISNNSDCLPSTVTFTERLNPVVVEQVARRQGPLGTFMMRLLGDLVNSGKTLHQVHSQLTGGIEISMTGTDLGGYMEFWNALCYLTAAEAEREQYWEKSAFFLQLCGVYANICEAECWLKEGAPMCAGTQMPNGEMDYSTTVVNEDGEEEFVRLDSSDEWYRYFVLENLDKMFEELDRDE